MDTVVAAVVSEVNAGHPATVVDLGCGSGQIALPVAASGATVIAVDVSPEMIAVLAGAAGEGTDVTAVVCAIEEFDLAAASVDVVASNYALHHLRDVDKRAVVESAARWLRPGGKLVIGDMMLGRGGERRDREIVAAKIAVMARRGPAGWWRIAKNAWRFLSRTAERPLPITTWQKILGDAGFSDVRGWPVVAEAAIVCGTRCG